MSKTLNSKISDFVISQYYESTRLKGILENFEDMLNADIATPAEDLKVEGGLGARGYWLELLGRRFAITRNITAFFFSIIVAAITMGVVKLL